MGLTIKQLNYMITYLLKILVVLVLVVVDTIASCTKLLLWMASGQDIFAETAYLNDKLNRKREIFFVNTGAYIMKYFN